MAHIVILISPGKYKNTEHRVAFLDGEYQPGDHQYTQEYLSKFDRLKWFGSKRSAQEEAHRAANELGGYTDVPAYELTLLYNYYSYFK